MAQNTATDDSTEDEITPAERFPGDSTGTDLEEGETVTFNYDSTYSDSRVEKTGEVVAVKLSRGDTFHAITVDVDGDLYRVTASGVVSTTSSTHGSTDRRIGDDAVVERDLEQYFLQGRDCEEVSHDEVDDAEEGDTLVVDDTEYELAFGGDVEYVNGELDVSNEHRDFRLHIEGPDGEPLDCGRLAIDDDAGVAAVCFVSRRRRMAHDYYSVELRKARPDGGDEDDDGDDWDPEPAQLRDGETVDRDSHAQRNAEQLRIARESGVLDDEDDSDDEPEDDVETDGGTDTETHVPDDDCVIMTDGGVDELEGERVLVDMTLGESTVEKRTGLVVNINPDRPNEDTGPEYVVDLDGAGQAYVTRHALIPVDEIPTSGVLMSTDDAVALFDAVQLALDVTATEWVVEGARDVDRDALAETSRTLGKQLALAGTDD